MSKKILMWNIWLNRQESDQSYSLTKTTRLSSFPKNSLSLSHFLWVFIQKTVWTWAPLRWEMVFRWPCSDWGPDRLTSHPRYSCTALQRRRAWPEKEAASPWLCHQVVQSLGWQKGPWYRVRSSELREIILPVWAWLSLGNMRVLYAFFWGLFYLLQLIFKPSLVCYPFRKMRPEKNRAQELEAPFSKP